MHENFGPQFETKDLVSCHILLSTELTWHFVKATDSWTSLIWVLRTCLLFVNYLWDATVHSVSYEGW